MQTPPAGFDGELGELAADVVVNGANRQPLDGDHLFLQGSRGAGHLQQTMPKMAQAGMLWVSWPKKASAVVTDLDESVVRELGIAAGLVDINTCGERDLAGAEVRYPGRKKKAGCKAESAPGTRALAKGNWY